MKKLLGVFLLVLSTGAAANTAYIENVRLVDVEHIHIGGTLTSVFYEYVDGATHVPIGCAANDTPISGDELSGTAIYQAVYYNPGVPNSRAQLLTSMAMSAMAMDKLVNIYMPGNNCNSGAVYGYGGRGRNMLGIKIRR